MKSIFLLIAISIFITLTSCNSGSTENQCTPKNLKEFEPLVIDSIKIKISNTTSDQNINYQVKEINGQQYFFRFNDYQSNTNPASIEIYNLKST
jgi:CO dehydrogenase/acetyl-CoA synthase delta subunit